MTNAGPLIAVYGSSTVREDEPGYRLARELGAELARRGATVMTGGYGGVMEAASRGAAEQGGHVVGVTVELFEERGPANRWVAERIHAPDLFERLRQLVTRAEGAVVVEGSLGTLTELFLTWTLLSIGAQRGGPLVLLGPAWSGYLEFHRRWIAAEHLRHVRLAAEVADAARLALAGTGAPKERTR